MFTQYILFFLYFIELIDGNLFLTSNNKRTLSYELLTSLLLCLSCCFLSNAK